MKVSIVLPCYNAERFIGRCLESLFAQTHRPLELIAVDDGSSDGTLALLEAARTRAPFPMTVLHQVNKGACAARNAGLALATGEYIQFMDADDRLLPEKVARHVSTASRNGWPDVVVGSARIHAHDGRLKQTDIQQPGGRDPWLDLACHRLGGTPNNLWRREALMKVGGWTEGLRSSQEYDLLFRLLQQRASLAYDPEPLTEVHTRSGSISTESLHGTWTRFIELRWRIIQHLLSASPGIDLHPYWQVLFDSIRTLYPYAPREAVALYRERMPSDFRPSRSPATGRVYLLLHRLLGFSWANRIRHWLSAPG